MGYYIRIRGRVQGPFDVDQIRSLARRGRFHRNYEVSTDRKEWCQAEEFPELFSRSEGGGRSAAEAEPEKPRSPDLGDALDPRTVRHAARRPVDDEDDDDGSFEDDEYEGGGLGGWIRDSVEGFVNAVKAQPLLSIGLLLGVLIVGTIFLFSEESWGPDREAYETLVAIWQEIDMQHAANRPAEWHSFGEGLQRRLQPTVERLTDSAKPDDHLKQELLFAARDDLPLMLTEIRHGEERARLRFVNRLSEAKRMLEAGSRQRVGGGAGVPAEQVGKLPVMGNQSGGQAAPGNAMPGGTGNLMPPGPGNIPGAQSGVQPGAQPGAVPSAPGHNPGAPGNVPNPVPPGPRE